MTDIDIVTLNLWIESRVQIQSVDQANSLVHLTTKTQIGLMQDTNPSTGVRYWVENVREALDSPGQWYLDRSNGVLYYFPMAGEDMRTTEVVAPRLDTILKLHGDDAGLVEMITIKDLKFTHTQHILPAGSAGYIQAAWGVSAAVYLRNAREYTIQNCEFTNLGTYAIEIGASSEKTMVRRNDIHDMGAGGIKIDGGGQNSIARLRYVAGRKWGTRKYMNTRLLKGGTAIEEALEA
jgi:hypothetical protein